MILAIVLCLYAFPGNAAPEDLVDGQQIDSVEERRILVSIEDKYAELAEREETLENREMELKTLQAEVDKKLASMQQLREELENLLDRKQKAENERIGELSRIYEKMEPEKSAVLLRQLDHQLAVELLLGIKKKTAGAIMDSLDPQTATELSKAFTEISMNE
jgi:flagellar motility protein MotE (MotC chaperone)